MQLLVATPVQPKRAKNPYMHFVAEKRAEYVKPELTAPQVVSAMGAAWRDMSDKEKAPYVKMADNDKKRFAKDLASFEKAGGVMQTKAKKKGEKKGEKKPKVKRAPSAYNLFIKKQMPALKEKNSKLNAPELMKLLGKEWHTLTDAKKKPFVAQAEKAKAELLA
jgi:hypothetical protein